MVAVGSGRGVPVETEGIGVSDGRATTIVGANDGLDAGTVNDGPGGCIVKKDGGGAAIGTQAAKKIKDERNCRKKTGFMVKE